MKLKHATVLRHSTSTSPALSTRTKPLAGCLAYSQHGRATTARAASSVKLSWPLLWPRRAMVCASRGYLLEVTGNCNLSHPHGSSARLFNRQLSDSLLVAGPYRSRHRFLAKVGLISVKLTSIRSLGWPCQAREEYRSVRNVFPHPARWNHNLFDPTSGRSTERMSSDIAGGEEM